MTIYDPDPISKKEEDFRKDNGIYPYGQILPDQQEAKEIEKMRNHIGFRQESEDG